jgi:hypothetical protein
VLPSEPTLLEETQFKKFELLERLSHSVWAGQRDGNFTGVISHNAVWSPLRGALLA